MPKIVLDAGVTAKRKRGRPKAASVRGNGIPIRIDPEIVRRTRVVTAYHRVPIGEYLSAILRPCVQDDYVNVLENLRREKCATKA